MLGLQRLDTFKDGAQDLIDFWRGVEKWIMLIQNLFLNCTIKVLSIIVVVGSQYSSHHLSHAYYVLMTPIFMSWLLSIYYTSKHDIRNICSFIPRPRLMYEIKV